MDKNSYNKSALNTEDGECYWCHKKCDTVRHEIFFGTKSRLLSKLLGMWVNLCPQCHQYLHGKYGHSMDATLKDEASFAFCRRTHDPKQFRLLFYGGAKLWDIENAVEEYERSLGDG